MNIAEASVGTRVRTTVAWACVPEGTHGVIDQTYHDSDQCRGFWVAWDLPRYPLPAGYCQYDGKPACLSHILRDGFSAVPNKAMPNGELEFLDVVK